MTRSAFAAIALIAIAGLPAHAAPVDHLPAAVGAASTMPQAPFRHVASNGTTKPTGSALDGRVGTTAALDRKSRDLHHLIATSICTGC
ncbi:MULTISPECIES: hypothetical protein [unclassified Methylobacterium]|uniref:hypothetical protein n=1 Tax=unclassified Methylobacterium TaxID=2615210 RepID=UPI000372D65F|nr:MULTISPECIES: hypothetical protein [unclassified Methylobacterium]SEG66543.1 hypothetical protein SAMN04488144_1366 [Methylobacterium sp. 190mf]